MLKMTVTDIKKLELKDTALTLPDYPEEYLDIILITNDVSVSRLLSFDFNLKKQTILKLPYENRVNFKIYLKVLASEHIEEIVESYPLAVSDVTAECILDSKKLTYGENVKEVYSLDLSTNFAYNPGNTISIIPKNNEEDIQKLFNHLGIISFLNKKCLVCERKTSKNKCKPSFLNKITTLHHLFTNCLDIHCIPKKFLIRVLSEFTEDPEEKTQLQELCSKEKSDFYMKNILESNKTFLELLLMFPSCRPPVARLIENLPKLLPRSYSIASSPLASPNRVKIVFSVVKTENREGLCTGMLKKIINNKNNKTRVKIFFRKCSGFNLPEKNVPLILIGPGTGVAPFIGFLQHRKMQKIFGTIWLFYGCRSEMGDYLFKDELKEYLDLGVLTKLCVAFSRDGDTKAKYVQDNIRLYGKEITEFILEKNAMIYVCGDAKNMRKDVQNSFVEVFENYRGMTNKEAINFIKQLQKDKRYLQDIWL